MSTTSFMSFLATIDLATTGVLAFGLLVVMVLLWVLVGGRGGRLGACGAAALVAVELLRPTIWRSRLMRDYHEVVLGLRFGLMFVGAGLLVGGLWVASRRGDYRGVAG